MYTLILKTEQNYALICSLASSRARLLTKVKTFEKSRTCLIFYSTTTFFCFAEMFALKGLIATKVQIP